MKTFRKQINKVSNHTLSNKASGFTIIETMVAVFILATSLTALLSLTSQSLFTARYARNEITANYLAQEAADYIRNQRDNTAFLGSGNNWTNFLNNFGKDKSIPSPSCFTNNGCNFNANDTKLEIYNCPSSGCVLKYRDDNSNSFYYHPSSTSDQNPNSIFKRTVKMKVESERQDEVIVTIKIDWTNGNVPKSKVLNFSLLNWYNFN